jgi:hypothetical protein
LLTKQNTSPVFSQTTFTNAQGQYSFDMLDMGTYDIQFVLPANKEVTLQDVGTDELLDSDINSSGTLRDIIINFGSAIEGINAGFIDNRGAVCGIIWIDENNDGIRSETDVRRLSNTKVVLLDTLGNRLDSIFTSADGAYEFNGLNDGLYLIQFGLDTTYFLSPPNLASDTSDSDVVERFFNLSSDTLRLTTGVKLQFVDAGVYQLASLGDRVLVDINEDGFQDAGDIGLNNVIVQLLDTNNTPIQSTITQSLGGLPGFYEFTNILPGEYVVEVQAPTFYKFTNPNTGGNNELDYDIRSLSGMFGATDPIPLLSGEINNSVDIGLVDRTPDPTTISGFLWEDLDTDGVREPNEPGQNGQTVTLYRENGSLVSTTQTNFSNDFNVDGYYEFTNLPAGNYYVVFSLPMGAFNTQPNTTIEGLDSDITNSILNNSTDIITIGPTIPALSTDGGFLKNGSIGNRTWIDFKMDGILEFENGVSFVQVNLRRPDGSLEATTFSDFFPLMGDGFYSFSNVRPGEYYLEFVPNENLLFTFPNQGNDDTRDSDVTGAFGPGTTDLFLLQSSEVKDDVDAGLVLQSSTIGDFVWLDLNGNGLQNTGEPGLNGIVVKLFSPTFGGLLIAETETTFDAANQAGSYHFDNIQPGLYYVEFERPEGLLFTQNVTSNSFLNSDVIDGELGRTMQFFVMEGTNNSSLDAGLFEPSSLGDFVWEDINANGIQDDGEPGIEGVTVNLFTSLPFPVASTVTDQDGFFCFDSLIEGFYSLEFERPDGYEFTQSDVGSDDTKDSDVNATGLTPLVSLAHGFSFKDLDAGLSQVGNRRMLSTVWVDENANGVREINESRMGNVEIELINHQGEMMEKIYSDQFGKFSFLTPSVDGIQIRAIPPNEYVFTSINVGSDQWDSDVDENGYSALIMPTSEISNLDIGLIPSGRIYVDIWRDKNANGIKDNKEVGLESIELDLFDMNGNLIDWNSSSKLKAGKAGVTFDELSLGTYQIKVRNTQDMLSTGPSNNLTETDIEFYEKDGALWSEPIEIRPLKAYHELSRGFYYGGQIISSVWLDIDRDGQRAPFERGVQDVYVTLIENQTGKIYTKLSDSEGSVHFNNLPVGHYHLRYFAFDNLDFTIANTGSDYSDSDVTGDFGPGTTNEFYIKNNFVTTHINAGIKGDLEGVDNLEPNLENRHTSSPKVKVFPNPTANFINVNHSFKEPVDFAIFDVRGALLKEGVIKDWDMKIDVSNYAPGLYTLKILKEGVPPVVFFKD